ncbi:MAG: hypothetical protein KAS72_09285 [Phycisphaerales bacterium]|nr:hypothetical protein [Phycisphaerales bacterium]
MFVKPAVRKDAALNRFARRRGLLFAMSRPEPERIELIYFPYYLFELSLLVKDGKQSVFVAADGVLGDLVFLEMETFEFVEQVDTPCFDFHIDMEKAMAKVLDEYQWILVKHGFHRKNPPKLEAVTDTRQLYYPYWVAYYKRRDGYDFNALDAVSCTLVAIPMRRAFLAAFAQQQLGQAREGS